MNDIRRLPSKSSGFTLIEILVVVLIIGITLSFAMLAFGDFGERRKIINTANQFASYVLMVKKEAILESNTLVIRIKGHRYDVLRLEKSSNLKPMSLSLFRNQSFPSKVEIYFTAKRQKENENLIVINPSGDITTFQISFGKSKDNIIATVSGKADGSIVVKTP